MPTPIPDPTTPPIPTFILRGHTSPIHALYFLPCQPVLLVSGDADGWLVIWSLASMRAVAVWRGHEGGVLGVEGWIGTRKGQGEGEVRIISHGRDHKLRIWHLPLTSLTRATSDPQRQSQLRALLPIDGATASSNPWPWLLHSFPVNALNYCAFSICDTPPPPQAAPGESNGNDTSPSSTSFKFNGLLLATPNGLDTGGIDVFGVPSCQRISRIASEKAVETGMVMTVSLVRRPKSRSLVLVCGYESGHVVVYEGVEADERGRDGPAERIGRGDEEDGYIWEKRLCVKPHTQPVLAVDVAPDLSGFITSSADALIAKYRIPDSASGSGRGQSEVKPVKVTDTKHAGQQDLTVRNDGKIFATAGWDRRVRVYSCKTLKEVAVLKWHREGCYAVAFARTDVVDKSVDDNGVVGHEKGQGEDNANEIADIKNGPSPLDQLKMDQEMKAQGAHWLAAGGKDGKISLWDIY